jgi:hypothetical protein
VKFSSAPVFQIVRRIDLSPTDETGVCILIAQKSDRSVVEELERELDVQIGETLAVIDATSLSPAVLVGQVRSAEARVVLIAGLESWSAEAFTAIDVNRSQFETGKFLIFKLDSTTVAGFLDRAPNLRSSIGTSIFMAAADPSGMSPEEVANRLRGLSDRYGMAGEDVIGRAQSGTLPPDPDFAEWLVLLGRGDLVR